MAMDAGAKGVVLGMMVKVRDGTRVWRNNFGAPGRPVDSCYGNAALKLGHKTQAPISTIALPKRWSVLCIPVGHPSDSGHPWIMPPARAVVVNLGPLQTGGR